MVYLLGDQIRGYNLGNGKYSVYVETDIADAKGMDYDQSSDVFFWTEEKDVSKFLHPLCYCFMSFSIVILGLGIYIWGKS